MAAGWRDDIFVQRIPAAAKNSIEVETRLRAK
jgi:hypothetical protein